MSLSAPHPQAAPAVAPALFGVTVFASATLVFMVQPMAAKLLLPLMGGTPAVWNTSMAFFQAALLVGYAYAHLLQRAGSVRRQAMIHGAALLIAALVLPLRVHEMLGPPTSDHPALWLLGALGLMVGAPFAVLSATAPLAQAWHARIYREGEGRGPYVLYAASNLGSLIALLGYPIAVEPTLAVQAQTIAWSLGYGGFVVLMACLGLMVARAPSQVAAAVAVEADGQDLAPIRPWRTRLIWIGLAAIPSSLMLGVTTHITTDVASAPFIWVVPLALYLLTFVIAFQDRPLISRRVGLLFHAAALAACAVIMPFHTTNLLLQLGIHLAAFFLTALVCHQTLVERRPPPSRLTEFYLCLSIGGVLGGGFNAFVAPVIFVNVWEYPLVLALACLGRPWEMATDKAWRWGLFAIAVVALAVAPVLAGLYAGSESVVRILLGVVTVAAFLIRRSTVLFFATITMLLISAQMVGDRVDVRQQWRSFFGVARQSVMPVEALGGTVHMLAHGTTLHGAQARAPEHRCRPIVYYAPETPIGQVFAAKRAEKASLTIGAVGLGTGTVAAFVRPEDRMTFFEIDPMMVRIANDPAYFTYTTECAKGPIDYVIGDARLTLQDQPEGQFDLLLLDAFSSDAVPAHLLTVEAVRMYLARLKPDGVLIMHLSNRNLDLISPAMAVVEAAGGVGLLQRHAAAYESPPLWESSEDVVIVARSEAALEPYENDVRWDPIDPTLAAPWTDAYTNLPGAMYARMKEIWAWLP
ncbi:spermidine synthase [Phenylobacterium sp.]|uniref:spermidine synthase n=1 Tax=Phenylobacterium sp. TaxID=1871053 RepID=UPI00272F3EF2|nr:fused MFS/spermidine synthase [Phenylobacterium sp.]MDP1618491.1 fused MFS/spermidine synthase [Phenylobacterium sp.]MDP1989172.1 fused MFS/spermidine synthase [Phenylobacterium sp.]